MLKLSKIKIFVVTILILFSFATCRKDNFRFPYVTINLSLGIYSDLGDLAAGNIKIFPKASYGGVGGLIVYRDFNDDYFVFDAACTYDYINSCHVESKLGSFQELMECPCCKSNFFIDSDGGYVFKGPAKYPLVSYQSFVDGGFLVIRN